jgi:hypothetical protein
MAAEDIGELVPTKIPGLVDQADIQAAFRLYHYGSYDFDINETDPAELINPSIAYNINDFEERIAELESGTGNLTASILNAKGSLITSTAASTASELSVGGSNGLVLTVNNATATGLEWATPAVTLTNSVTLSNKTLSAPILTGTSVMSQVLETATFSAIAATGTINYDLLTNGAVTYYTSNATDNWTLNIRGNSGTSLNSVMSTGQILSVVFLVTNGSTAYYQTGIQIDGNSVTPKWQFANPPSSGNTNSIDAYTISIFKTGNATFTVLENQTRFA